VLDGLKIRTAHGKTPPEDDGSPGSKDAKEKDTTKERRHGRKD